MNAYYGICYQIIVVTVQARAVFVPGRTGTVYFYKDDGGGLENATPKHTCIIGRSKPKALTRFEVTLVVGGLLSLPFVLR